MVISSGLKLEKIGATALESVVHDSTPSATASGILAVGSIVSVARFCLYKGTISQSSGCVPGQW